MKIDRVWTDSLQVGVLAVPLQWQHVLRSHVAYQVRVIFVVKATDDVRAGALSRRLGALRAAAASGQRRTVTGS